MRLGQLARKLALRPADIVDFLAENDIKIPDGTNVRLEKDHLVLVMKRFVPGWVDASEADVEAEEGILPVEAVAETPESVAPSNTTTEYVDQPATAAAVGDEVIRAPKIELSGLKVVGKIDLPEPKKKEELVKEEDDRAGDDKEEKWDNRRPGDVNRRRHRRSDKNPVAVRREREAREAEKKRLDQQAREKEKRTQNYLKNYKPSSPTKPVKLIKEDVVEMTPQELEEPPKTLFGKIIRWLTKAS